MDKQEIFDKVFLGLKSQNFQLSFAEGQGCRYRGPNGLKCAIGHLISDEEYDPNMETHTVRELKYCLLNLIQGEEMLEFLADLQCIHDNCLYRDDGDRSMEQELRSFALENNLSVPT